MESSASVPSPQLTVPLSEVRELLHDLGGPLVAAQGFLSLLDRDLSAPSAPRYAAGVKEALENMRELIERMRSECRQRDGR